MIENILNSFNSENIKRVIICRDSISEQLSEILFNNIVNIMLNKNIKNIILYNYNNINGDEINRFFERGDFYVLNLPYCVDVNGDLMIKNDLKYNTDVLLVLKENNMLLLKHREITPLFGKKIDMLPYIRMDKIKRIKNNIYNKNIKN